MILSSENVHISDFNELDDGKCVEERASIANQSEANHSMLPVSAVSSVLVSAMIVVPAMVPIPSLSTQLCLIDEAIPITPYWMGYCALLKPTLREFVRFCCVEM